MASPTVRHTFSGLAAGLTLEDLVPAAGLTHGVVRRSALEQRQCMTQFATNDAVVPRLRLWRQFPPPNPTIITPPLPPPTHHPSPTSPHLYPSLPKPHLTPPLPTSPPKPHPTSPRSAINGFVYCGQHWSLRSVWRHVAHHGPSSEVTPQLVTCYL